MKSVAQQRDRNRARKNHNNSTGKFPTRRVCAKNGKTTFPLEKMKDPLLKHY